VIIPSGLAPTPGIAWPLSSALPPMGALTSVPGTVRSHVRAVLAGWGLADLTEVCELVASELATNAVRASTAPSGRVLYVNGRMRTVRVCLLSDGYRTLIEVYDQAFGEPVMKTVSASAESGRGLAMIDALTGGRWGWHTVQGQASKCVWAELSADV
jgi:anti-sigma regulatory factor (Ser/Thr protein kinase)